jgi:DNA-binding transcriptional LysR family regulator
MTDISSIALRRLDLTVLLVFLGLMRRRKASDVAAQLGLTQSAVSHSIRRLRSTFRDDLFLRRPHGLEPTSVALALEPHIATAVDALRTAIAAPKDFDPGTAEGIIRIAAFDAELATLLPDLIRTLSVEAPGLRIAGRGFSRRQALDALIAGDIDLALGFFRDLEDTFLADHLFIENYLVVGSRNRRPFEPAISLDDYIRLPHILVSPAGDLRGVVDDLLEVRGLARHIVAAMPLFLPALAALEATGAIATIPRRIALRYAEAFNLVTSEPPLAIRSFEISAIRHRRDERSPLLNWLVGKLRHVSAAPRLP